MAEFPTTAVFTAMLFQSVTAFCAGARPGTRTVMRPRTVNSVRFIQDSPGGFEFKCDALEKKSPSGRGREGRPGSAPSFRGVLARQAEAVSWRGQVLDQVPPCLERGIARSAPLVLQAAATLMF